mmetsp:Transcript_31093/g.41125  ORF Transcript_31093/g.41125 Transcript_31093/m.41125 type:complete len:220 (-) Transcript_31093:614-1273(-)|eukprot:CAMPEP_0117757532 /NCGR_PEP_ID=MMETSP0947-20121206/14794_1 /TAXON_ID=44440 /ORGANISM="Chattonella subsalsa, Strain CCMP2191" /LENGTH=219 /DNA_ID=CAMNT_0005577457 /DNA_START=19 /DNA_END=678 /DNA_ORIENTATION=+
MSFSGKSKPGRLVFKGGEAAVFTKKKKKKKRKKSSEDDKEKDVSGETHPSKETVKEEENLQLLVGTGRITSSGLVVHGYDTEFMNELSNGDAIMITHPTSLKEETRIVKMVLSNISISISSPFSTDLITTCTFHYIKAPKEEISQDQKEQGRKRKKMEEEKSAFGTYASDLGTKFVYRVKKPGIYGGYEIIEESSETGMSREELLDKRSKKKSDRMCAF